MNVNLPMSYISAILVALAPAFTESSAENICDETPPAGRAVDGIPAYAQCDGSDGSVYSNNGIDTRASSGGDGWVRTQMGGGYQCTEFAHRYLRFRHNLKTIPNGNAGTWGDNKLPAGLVKTTAPVHGDLIIFAPGSCGASTTAGHVAVIDAIDGTTLTIVEQNGASRRKCKASCAKCFLHAESNTVIAGGTRPEGVVKESDLWVSCTPAGIAFYLSGDLNEGATLKVYDLRGRQASDLTNRITAGRALYRNTEHLPDFFLVVAEKNGRSVCRKVFWVK